MWDEKNKRAVSTVLYKCVNMYTCRDDEKVQHLRFNYQFSLLWNKESSCPLSGPNTVRLPNETFSSGMLCWRRLSAKMWQQPLTFWWPPQKFVLFDQSQPCASFSNADESMSLTCYAFFSNNTEKSFKPKKKSSLKELPTFALMDELDGTVNIKLLAHLLTAARPKEWVLRKLCTAHSVIFIAHVSGTLKVSNWILYQDLLWERERAALDEQEWKKRWWW